jgi:putative SOS response-associated peptidase YedK
MCERYVIPDRADVEREFRVAQPWWRFAPSYNVASGRNVPVIRQHEGQSEGVMLRWGLVPEWAEGDVARGCATHIPAVDIARSTLSRDAWSKGRRCILPLSGFYAWQLTPARYRQPYYVRVSDRGVFGIAALWDRTVAEEEDDVIDGCAIIVVPSNPLMSEVETTVARMPVILAREDYETWLTAPAPRAKALLRAYPDTQMLAHPISPRINSLKHDDADLIEPVGAPRARAARETAAA